MNAATQDAQQQDEMTEQPQADARTPIHSVEFPEAREAAPAAGSGQLDLLLDMDVPISVVLGGAQIPVRRLLQLGPGSVLRLEKPVEEPVDLYLKDSKFAEADVVVVENRFAVRIRQIVATAGHPSQP
jgi:flagellar motor switch protein FliN/FliY